MKLIIYFIIIYYNLFQKQKIKKFANRFSLNIKNNMKKDYKFILKNSASQWTKSGNRPDYRHPPHSLSLKLTETVIFLPFDLDFLLIEFVRLIIAAVRHPK